ncbi:MAG TPA: HipA domain-containing protein [bacterium]|nr:HipA domain-containing protein [bacterium]
MNKDLCKKMFRSSNCPKISFALSDVMQQAQILAGKLSISGVQPKLSVKLDKKTGSLIVAEKDGEYILKPQTQAFLNIPENEQCCMDIASELGIEVPYHCLLPLKDKSLAYVVKRFDRNGAEKIHQEDFAQILGQDKYNGSVEQIGKKLKQISVAPGYDSQLFFERVVFNFILGNGDAHLKNYSISYKETGIRLSPAYDIVCSKLVIADEEDSALTINGKKHRLSLDDFNKFAEYLNVPTKIRYEKFKSKFSVISKIVNKSYLPKHKQKEFLEIIHYRMGLLELL